jgi:hypothetical protein
MECSECHVPAEETPSGMFACPLCGQVVLERSQQLTAEITFGSSGQGHFGRFVANDTAVGNVSAPRKTKEPSLYKGTRLIDCFCFLFFLLSFVRSQGACPHWECCASCSSSS